MKDGVQTKIPEQFICYLTFRIFKVTLIHEVTYRLRPDSTIWLSGNSIPIRNFGFENGLDRYLSFGWPEPVDSAKWHQFHVDVYADDLFLCPRCGRFHPRHNVVNTATFPWFDFTEGDELQHGSMWGFKIPRHEFTRLRDYAEGRLQAKEFRFKECDDIRSCSKERRKQLFHHNSRREKRLKQIDLESLGGPEPEIVRIIPPTGEKFVYLVRGGDYYKIGKTKSVEKRISTLKTSSPFQIQLIKRWPSADAARVEKQMHICFQKYRVNREWFQLPDDVLGHIQAFENIDHEFLGEGLVNHKLIPVKFRT